MSVIGLIVEYNPLHNGHLYHFNTSKRISQAQYSICVMSGNFVQRGEPAIVDKWSRAAMALEMGVDLVLELPTVYAVQSAEIFAYGSVSILNSLGIVDKICFGSEAGEIDLLKIISQIISEEPEHYKKILKENLSYGKPFASARTDAIIDYLKQSAVNDCQAENIRSVLKSSNNILSLEYLKWLNRLESSIEPLTIKRIHSNYNDLELGMHISSATAIRRAILNGMKSDLKGQVPDYCLDILNREEHLGKSPIFADDFSQPIICRLRQMTISEIREILDVNEGLEYKIKKASLSSSSIDELVEKVVSKRYTSSRIRRILCHSLLNLKGKDLYSFNSSGGPKYARVLGFSQNGKRLISMAKKTSRIPFITNVSDYRKQEDEILKRMLEIDILSTDLYVTAYKNVKLRYGGWDFYQSPIRI